MNFQIEKVIEDSTLGFLSERLPDVDFFVGGGQSVFVTPRVEIHANNLSAVEPLDEIKQQTSSGVVRFLDYAKHDLDLSLIVVTDLSQGSTRSSHFDLVNQVRNEMRRSRVDYSNERNPDFDVYEIKLDSTERELTGELTITVTNYTLRITHKTNIS